jgi:hypothetical protein
MLSFQYQDNVVMNIVEFYELISQEKEILNIK